MSSVLFFKDRRKDCEVGSVRFGAEDIGCGAMVIVIGYIEDGA